MDIFSLWRDGDGDGAGDEGDAGGAELLISKMILSRMKPRI
jgi:hypothetical protein